MFHLYMEIAFKILRALGTRGGEGMALKIDFTRMPRANSPYTRARDGSLLIQFW